PFDSLPVQKRDRFTKKNCRPPQSQSALEITRASELFGMSQICDALDDSIRHGLSRREIKRRFVGATFDPLHQGLNATQQHRLRAVYPENCSTWFGCRFVPGFLQRRKVIAATGK